MSFALERSGNRAPLHTQIHQELRRRIVTDELPQGAPFPSERELADAYRVSRMTVRQALKALRQDGLIYNERGVGAFVSKRKLDVHTRNLGGFSEEMQRRGLQPSSKVLTLRREFATEQIASSLSLSVNAEVFYLERLRLADNTPLAYERAFLPVALCPNLDDYNLEKLSLYDVLQNRFNLEIHRAEEILEAACASREQAKILGIRANAAVLAVNRVVYTESDEAIESVNTLYRADLYRATFFLTKNNL